MSSSELRLGQVSGRINRVGTRRLATPWGPAHFGTARLQRSFPVRGGGGCCCGGGVIADSISRSLMTPHLDSEASSPTPPSAIITVGCSSATRGTNSLVFERQSNVFRPTSRSSPSSPSSCWTTESRRKNSFRRPSTDARPLNGFGRDLATGSLVGPAPALSWLRQGLERFIPVDGSFLGAAAAAAGAGVAFRWGMGEEMESPNFFLTVRM
ncbi:hypothetical protein DAPPUDRAFT_114219 [Daphnia pulex]|uniref:Uncharacterized protein n=1 Tax=Daphnia pulex TaxID=6669 RepID=E9HHF2_DAPPU|nr:hypothetical protein DAPPUDRAFT_114219 [Daphnia pulex]|eukprot:EFX68854.1 hypothetical protein DAPPUDRAFT_114219 [Daphnia pulex]